MKANRAAVCALVHTPPLSQRQAPSRSSLTPWVATGLSHFFFCDHAPALPYPSADPEKYTPLYGCYCAYAMSKGGLAPADPLSFLMIDGKLHLFVLKERDAVAGRVDADYARGRGARGLC